MKYYVYKQIDGLICLYKNCIYSSNLKYQSNNLLNSFINRFIFIGKGKNEFKRKLKLFIWLLFASVMINTGYAAVTPVTSLTRISGNFPKLVLISDESEVTNQNIYQFATVKAPNPYGSGSIDVIAPEKALFVSKNIIYFDEIDINKIVAEYPIDGKYHDLPVKVLDIDGDADKPEDVILEGATIRFKWNKNDDQTKLTRCSGTLDVEILIPTIKVGTKYPTGSDYTLRGPGNMVSNSSIERHFSFYRPQICHFEPFDPQMVWDNDLGTWGVNRAKWDPYNILSTRNGYFRYDSGFPKTGFKGAKFRIVPNKEYLTYRCSSKDNGGKIILSTEKSEVGTHVNENCMVTYNSETLSEFTAGGTPTITLEYLHTHKLEGEDEWVVTDTWTIPKPTKWGIYKGVASYGNTVSLNTSTQFPALDLCRGLPLGTTTKQQATGQNITDKMFRQQFMYRREELANTKFSNPNNYPEGSNWTNGVNTIFRDVDNTFLDEWGQLDSYLKTKAVNPEVWTAESNSSQYQATAAIMWDGGHFYQRVISDRAPYYGNGVVFCRGE